MISDVTLMTIRLYANILLLYFLPFKMSTIWDIARDVIEPYLLRTGAYSVKDPSAYSSSLSALRCSVWPIYSATTSPSFRALE